MAKRVKVTRTVNGIVTFLGVFMTMGLLYSVQNWDIPLDASNLTSGIIPNTRYNMSYLNFTTTIINNITNNFTSDYNITNNFTTINNITNNISQDLTPENNNITNLWANASGQENHIGNIWANISTITTNITNLWGNASGQETHINNLWNNASNQDGRIIAFETKIPSNNINIYDSGMSTYIRGKNNTHYAELNLIGRGVNYYTANLLTDSPLINVFQITPEGTLNINGGFNADGSNLTNVLHDTGNITLKYNSTKNLTIGCIPSLTGGMCYTGIYSNGGNSPQVVLISANSSIAQLRIEADSLNYTRNTSAVIYLIGMNGNSYANQGFRADVDNYGRGMVYMYSVDYGFFMPQTDSLADIGKPNYKWKNGYFGGDINSSSLFTNKLNTEKIISTNNLDFTFNNDAINNISFSINTYPSIVSSNNYLKFISSAATVGSPIKPHVIFRTVDSNEYVYISSNISGGYLLLEVDGTVGGGRYIYSYGTTNPLYIGSESNSLDIYPNTVSGPYFRYSNTTLNPSVSNVIDLGKSTLLWKNGYFGGDVNSTNFYGTYKSATSSLSLNVLGTAGGVSYVDSYSPIASGLAYRFVPEGNFSRGFSLVSYPKSTGLENTYYTGGTGAGISPLSDNAFNLGYNGKAWSYIQTNGYRTNGTYAGVSKLITVMKTAVASCTMEFMNGILIATTCG